MMFTSLHKVHLESLIDGQIVWLVGLDAEVWNQLAELGLAALSHVTLGANQRRVLPRSRPRGEPSSEP